MGFIIRSCVREHYYAGCDESVIELCAFRVEPVDPVGGDLPAKYARNAEP